MFAKIVLAADLSRNVSGAFLLVAERLKVPDN